MVCGIAGADEARLLILLSIAHASIIAVWSVWGRREVVPAIIRRFSPVWLAVAPLAAVCTFLLATGMVTALHRLVGVQELRVSSDLIRAGYGWPFIIILSCVQPAIFEELGFRGIILPTLQPTLAVNEAVIVSALLFMTLHLTIAGFPHLFIIGLALGYMRVRSGSLLPGMLMHFTHNFLCVWTEHGWF